MSIYIQMADKNIIEQQLEARIAMKQLTLAKFKLLKVWILQCSVSYR